MSQRQLKVGGGSEHGSNRLTATAGRSRISSATRTSPLPAGGRRALERLHFRVLPGRPLPRSLRGRRILRYSKTETRREALAGHRGSSSERTPLRLAKEKKGPASSVTWPSSIRVRGAASPTTPATRFIEVSGWRCATRRSTSTSQSLTARTSSRSSPTRTFGFLRRLPSTAGRKPCDTRETKGIDYNVTETTAAP